MRAVIYQVGRNPGIGMILIAGRPLVLRQLEWLRAMGVDEVALEYHNHPESDEIAYWVKNRTPLGADVNMVLTDEAMGASEVAKGAGFDPPFLGLPADVIGDGDLTEIFGYGEPSGVIAKMKPPKPLRRLDDGFVQLIDSGADELVPRTGPGWAVRINGFKNALDLSKAVLEGTLPDDSIGHVWAIQIAAHERSPGIWVGRGAKIDPEATLVSPVMVGERAIIFQGARIGPNAYIGDRAVIERGTFIVDSIVAPGTIVGENLEFREMAVSSHSHMSVPGRQSGDHLLVASRRHATSTTIGVGAIRAIVFFMVIILPLAAAYFFFIYD